MIKITNSYLLIALVAKGILLTKSSSAMNGSEDNVLNNESMLFEQELIEKAKEQLIQLDILPENIKHHMQSELVQMESFIKQYEGTLTFLENNTNDEDPAVQEQVKYFREAKIHTEQEISSVQKQIQEVLQKLVSDTEDQGESDQFNSSFDDHLPPQKLLGQQISQQLKEQQNKSFKQFFQQSFLNKNSNKYLDDPSQKLQNQQIKYVSDMQKVLDLQKLMNQSLKK